MTINCPELTIEIIREIKKSTVHINEFCHYLLGDYEGGINAAVSSWMEGLIGKAHPTFTRKEVAVKKLAIQTQAQEQTSTALVLAGYMESRHKSGV